MSQKILFTAEVMEFFIPFDFAQDRRAYEFSGYGSAYAETSTVPSFRTK